MKNTLFTLEKDQIKSKNDTEKYRRRRKITYQFTRKEWIIENRTELDPVYRKARKFKL